MYKFSKLQNGMFEFIEENIIEPNDTRKISSLSTLHLEEKFDSWQIQIFRIFSWVIHSAFLNYKLLLRILDFQLKMYLILFLLLFGKTLIISTRAEILIWFKTKIAFLSYFRCIHLFYILRKIKINDASKSFFHIIVFIVRLKMNDQSMINLWSIGVMFRFSCC